MSKHTPGPWTIGALESGQAAVDGANGEEVTGFISPADAALIAAAPDMLAALEESAAILRLLDPLDSPGGSEKLSAAIANAAAALALAKGTP